MVLVAAGLAALTVLVLLGRPRDRRLRPLLETGSCSGSGKDAGTRPPAAGPAEPAGPAPRLRGRRPARGAADGRAGRSGLLVRTSPPAAACALAGLSCVLLVPWPAGLLLGGVVAGAGPRLLARLEPKASRDERERLLADLPLVLDLLAACLAGGAPLPHAARAVAHAVPGPAGQRLAAVEAALAVGSPPADAWRALSAHRDDDPLAPAARALARAADGGAPVAAAVSRLAADARTAARARGEQAARRVGVLAVAPLGLCFLPAFVLLGVVPVVVGLAGPLLASF